ncbi:hypothetical protein GCM10026983_09080 [Gracilibacillus alcaliphilus]
MIMEKKQGRLKSIYRGKNCLSVNRIIKSTFDFHTSEYIGLIANKVNKKAYLKKRM